MSNRPPPSYSNKVQSTSIPTSDKRPNPVRNSPVIERKFNIAVYGLEECQKGTPRHEWMTRDMDSVTSIVQSACPSLTEHSVRDCTRLGKYSSDRHRPILVKLTRSCEAATILANRTKIQAPGILIKPHLTQQERTNESILLRERRNLINSGIKRNNIKLRRNAIYVNNKRHGSVTASGYKPCSHPDTEPINTQSDPAEPTNTQLNPNPPTSQNETDTAVANRSNQWLSNSIALWNARSLVNKLDFCQSLIYSKSYDIICITETWLHDQILNNEILPTNYMIYRRDRESCGGGVLIAVINAIPSKLISIQLLTETISIELDLSPKLLVTCLYIPPNCSDSYQQEVLNCLSSLNTDSNTILLGDFNTPDINWSTLNATSPFSHSICNLTHSANYIQLISNPTHKHGNILDLILTNAPHRIQNLHVDDTLCSQYSDHFLISARSCWTSMVLPEMDVNWRLQTIYPKIQNTPQTNLEMF